MNKKVGKPKMSRWQLYNTLKQRDGLTCNICGKSLEEEWLELLVWKEHKHMKRTHIDVDIDHVYPKSKVDYKINWWDDLDNLHLAHRSCNFEKGATVGYKK